MSTLVDLLAQEVRAPSSVEDIATSLHAAAVELVRMGAQEVAQAGAEEILARIVSTWPEEHRPDEAEIMRSAAWAAENARLTSSHKPAEGRIVLRSHADRTRDHMTPTMMVIAGLLPIGGIGAIVAMPGVGKTLVATHVTQCVAAGATFLGRSTMAGRVIYACPDSPASTERRMLAIPAEVATRIFTVAELPALPGGIDDLRAAVQAANADADVPVRLLVIDTWDSARTHSGEGYAGQDSIIEGAMRGLRSMAADLALAVLVIHHATRSDNGRARGSVVFDARADWIAVADGDGTVINLRSIKCRDGERGDLGTFQIASEVINGSAVPVLAPFGNGTPVASRMPPDDREGAVLAILARHEGVIAKRPLAERSGVPEGSVLRVVAALRAKGLVEPDRLMATAAGFRAYESTLFGVDQGLDQGVA